MKIKTKLPGLSVITCLIWYVNYCLLCPLWPQLLKIPIMAVAWVTGQIHQHVLNFQWANVRNMNNSFLLTDGLISFCYIAFLTARVFKIKVGIVTPDTVATSAVWLGFPGMRMAENARVYFISEVELCCCLPFLSHCVHVPLKVSPLHGWMAVAFSWTCLEKWVSTS